MPRTPQTLYVYPMSNYTMGIKQPKYEKDGSVRERMLRMEQQYKSEGMRRHVEGILLAHCRGHVHLLLFQIGNTYFKLFVKKNFCSFPGGRLKGLESETDGLKRKLTNKLGTPNPKYSMTWTIGELISQWWRPNFETVTYPYIPPHVSSPKECRKMFLVQLQSQGLFGVPKNLKLLAVPLFEMYSNAHRYGATLASLPQLLSRIHLVICDKNGNPIQNTHLNAYLLENQHIHWMFQQKLNQLQIQSQSQNQDQSQSQNQNQNQNQSQSQTQEENSLHDTQQQR
ncbi:hypothetical protein RFI_01396 [Reticulomyxa filosa]|uniref:Cleavage and polyadenylation specificity factor subunit 5 n=1 Tax=Reticulomyxa filosa TaxID=46433 RepID=X6PDB6_RETFI|nr:hypothetical protein RFI_01396 [Reticulomyxa filosa]|eukprot:ETO35667.1 hypothetical protein RFI_01396 [Reticulomyxa filosa]